MQVAYSAVADDKSHIDLKVDNERIKRISTFIYLGLSISTIFIIIFILYWHYFQLNVCQLSAAR